jgi:hypothetical protein
MLAGGAADGRRVEHGYDRERESERRDGRIEAFSVAEPERQPRNARRMA